MTEVALRIRDISKAYSVPVLSGISMELNCGEVHALVGANGAGKSTLARIISGLTPPDAGHMELLGSPYAPSRKAHAEEAGVCLVQQELNVIPTLSVAENLFLNRLPRRLGFISQARLAEDARRALQAVGLGGLPPGTPAGTLGVGQQQLIEIASALTRKLKVLILDEPTAALTRPEIDLLFARIRELRAAGVAMIYISHRMEEIRTICDRVTVLRDGKLVASCLASEASLDQMVSAMVTPRAGDEATSPVTRTRAEREPGPVILQVSGITRGRLTRNVSFSVRRGEILGLSGLVGSGRTETLRTIFGAELPHAGSVAVGDPLRPVRIRSPRDAVRAGIGMLPEDRKSQGLLLTQSILRNISLANIGKVSGAGGWLAPRQEKRIAEDYRQRLAIRCAAVEQPARELSGGNQQKVLLARWLLRDCDVLLFDEPTRGIDIAARASIYELLEELAAAGKGLVVASSDLEELMQICDRIAVLSAGEITATYPRGEWTEDLLMSAAFQNYASTRPEPASSHSPSEVSLSS